MRADELDASGQALESSKEDYDLERQGIDSNSVLSTAPRASALPPSLRRLAWLMDKSIPLPGNMRFGLDGLIGLIPGVGDALTGTVSGYIIYQAHKLGAPLSLKTRMTANALIDFTVGSIPLIGDIFDFAFKANHKNIRLLENHLNKEQN